jgi:hypothetical protein
MRLFGVTWLASLSRRKLFSFVHRFVKLGVQEVRLLGLSSSLLLVSAALIARPRECRPRDAGLGFCAGIALWREMAENGVLGCPGEIDPRTRELSE